MTRHPTSVYYSRSNKREEKQTASEYPPSWSSISRTMNRCRMRARPVSVEARLVCPGAVTRYQLRYRSGVPLGKQTSCGSTDRRTISAFVGEKSPVVSIHNAVVSGHKDRWLHAICRASVFETRAIAEAQTFKPETGFC